MRIHDVPRRAFGLGLLVAALGGCGTEKGAATQQETGASTPMSPAELASLSPDLDAVMRRVHFSFRADGQTFTGGHKSYAVNANARELRVTPFRAGPRQTTIEGAEGAPFVASVEKISRGTTILAGQDGQPTIRPDASLGIQRGTIVEHLENTEEGVEQSFTFAERPAGNGDVEVRIAVTGEVFVGETEGGLHFADLDAGLGIRYGKATWVDARGVRTPVASRFGDGHITLTVPADVLEKSAYPAVLDPIVGPEIAIDTPVYAATNDDQYQTVVSFGGTNYLVVWADERYQNSLDVYGVRVTPAGTILDTSGIPIAVAKNDQYQPAMAWDGANWMVAWQDYRTNGSGDIYAARVSGAGTVLDPNGIAVAVGSSRTYPAIAFDGTNYLVTHINNSTVRGTFVGTNGMVNPSPIAISTPSYGPYANTLAFNGTNYLAAYTTYSGAGNQYRLLGRRISPAGSILDASDVFYCDTNSTCGYSRIAASSDGTNFLLVWDDYGANAVMYGQRVGPGGARIDAANGFLIGSGSVANTPASIAVAFAGNGYGVFWDDGNNVFGARISSGAAILVPATALTNEMGTRTYPGAAHDGTNFLVAFRDTRLANTNNAADIFGLRVSNALVKVDMTSQLLSRQANDENRPKIAYNGTNYLVVWEDYRPGLTADIIGARMNTSGTVLDANGITISSATNTQVFPAVAANGPDWLVTWQDRRNGAGTDDIYAARVQANGSVPDTMGIVVNSATGNQQTPVVAADGTNYMVTWRDETSTEIWGARVTPAGAVLDMSAFKISTGGGSFPAIAYNGTNYLVAWTKPTNSNDVFGARVTPGAAVLDSGALAIPISASVGIAENRSAVTSNGSDWLVAWDDNLDVKAARVNAAGTILDVVGITVVSAANVQSFASVAWDGTQYWVVWQDERTTSGSPDLYAGRLASNGMVKDMNGFSVATDVLQHELRPAVAAGPAQNLMLAYYRFDPLQPYGSYRVRARQLSDVAPGANGTACTIAAQCMSGFCADGVCCDGACNNTCQACTMVKKGTGTDGVCGPVAGDTDPDNECTDQGANSCSTNGSCNGAGACKLYASGTNCGNTCVGTSSQPRTCDGSGICANTGMPTSCTPYNCDVATGNCKTMCTTVNDCAAGSNCMNNMCVGLQGNGAACMSAVDCQSGFCVDGVCCNSACTSTCQACSAAKKGAGADGTCGPVVTGADPDNECTTDAQSTCGKTGTCNGAGSCQLYASGTTCGSPVCQGTVLKAQVCDGVGSCITAAMGQDCAPYACSGGACLGSCTMNTDCASGSICSMGSCIPPIANGGTCLDGTQCQSGNCVDGICCNTACTGLCVACTVAKKGNGSDGICGPIVVGTDPDNECSMQASTSCGQTGSCNGAGACQLYAQGTSCGTSICQGSVVKGQICNGMGQCVQDSVGQDCAPYVCSGGACQNPCANSNECLMGYVCLAGACQLAGSAGSPCATAGECATGFCVDGVCCDAACIGACQACSTAKKGQGSDGMCGPIKNGTDPDNECAGQAPSTCKQNGQCNGAGACAQHAQGTQCSAGSCTGTTQTNPSQCDGVGTCVPGGQTMCIEGYTCLQDKCTTSCTMNSECAAGYECDTVMQWCVPSGMSGSSSSSSSSGMGGAGGAASSSSGNMSSSSGIGGSNSGGMGGTGGMGMGGMGGTPGTGGMNTTGGMGGTAGAGTGGTEVGGNGSGGTPGGGTTDGGCGCRTAGGSSAPFSAGALLALGVMVGMRRRQRKASAVL